MSPTLEEDLRAALRTYTAGVTASPTLTAAVRHGAGRRRRRRRAVLLTAPVLAAALVAAAVIMLPRVTYAPPDLAAATTSLPAADRALLTAPTAGDLAGDSNWVTTVGIAWQNSHGDSINADRGIFDRMLGSPHVVWTGNTAAGRAAFVVQLADLREHGNVQLTREGVALLWGFVDAGADGLPTVVADGYPVPGAPSTQAAFLGPRRSVLLVADRGQDREQVSWGLEYAADGTVARRWQPVRFADGVAVVAVPAGVNPGSTRLRNGDGTLEDIGNQSDGSTDPAIAPPDPRLQWADANGFALFPVGTDPARAWGGRLPDAYGAEEALEAVLDTRQPSTFPDVAMVASSLWYVAGRTADGRRLVAGEKVFDTDPSRVYTVLGTAGPTLRVLSTRPDPGQAVPVRVALPDGQGRLLAAKGKTLTWQQNGIGRSARDAALVPAGATDVRVDGAPVS
jgi:hypothetical protein